MKLLADENVPQTIIKFLQAQGHTVIDAKRTLGRGAPDEALLLRAEKEHVILLTFDKDFVTPTYLSADTAVVILSFPRTKPKEVLPYIVRLLSQLKTKSPKRPYRMLLQKESLAVLPG